MLGREELAKLSLQKQALLLESSLNRAALQAEIQSLRSARTWVTEVTNLARELRPLLVLLAPVAGFFVAKGVRRSGSWLGRVVSAVKWMGPLYGLWKRFAPGRKEAEADTPTV